MSRKIKKQRKRHGWRCIGDPKLDSMHGCPMLGNMDDGWRWGPQKLDSTLHNCTSMDYLVAEGVMTKA